MSEWMDELMVMLYESVPYQVCNERKMYRIFIIFL